MYHNELSQSQTSIGQFRLEHTCSSLIQMQKLDTLQLASKFHGVSHDHPTCLVSLAPTRLKVIVISGLPLFLRIMFFVRLPGCPATMHCNRATFLSHGQGGALAVVKNCINEAVSSSQSFTRRIFSLFTVFTTS